MILKKNIPEKPLPKVEPSALIENDQERAVSEIQASGLFDREWYLKQYLDVAEAGVDPLVHYVNAGAAEGRQPGPQFDVTWYLG